MLYLDFAQYKEEFILENEGKYPRWIKNLLYFFRKITACPIRFELDGKNVVRISKFNKKIEKKLDKIFNMDVTKTVCICEKLRVNEDFMRYIKEREFNIIDGRWLFKYMICDIAEFICKKQKLVPEEQEVSIKVKQPDDLIFETIKRLGKRFKNINIITNKVKQFNKIKDEIYQESGLVLNVTKNLKKNNSNSKIVIDVDSKENNADSYFVNLPPKFRNIYKKLNNFNSSILYESLIYKKTSPKNIWDEIAKDNIEIIAIRDGSF